MLSMYFSCGIDGKECKGNIEELKSGKFANIAERAGRAQDQDDGAVLRP